MQKTLPLLCLFVSMVFLANAQDTISGYTFPEGNVELDIYPNLGLEGNDGYYISAGDTVAHPNTNHREISFTNGVTDFAATADEWQDGEMAKLWSVKFKAQGYKDLKISSKQRSGGNKPGPKDWKIQARMSGSDWVDVENGNLTVANDWTTGVAENLALPEMFDDPGSSSIYIRWIMTSNLDINGNPVEASGVSKIDDVIITGELVSGFEEILFSNKFSIYPNPAAHGVVYLDAKEKITALRIIDMNGRIMKEVKNPGMAQDVSDLNAGVYFMQIAFDNGSFLPPGRLIVK